MLEGIEEVIKAGQNRLHHSIPHLNNEFNKITNLEYNLCTTK